MTRAAILRAGWVLGALAASSTAAPAADVVKLTSGLVYDPATVRGIKSGTLEFVFAGRLQGKDIADVARLKIGGFTALNRAEDLMAKQKYAEAVTAYAAAAQAVTKGWKRDLCRYRLLAAATKGRLAEKAVATWLQIADGSGGPLAALSVRPKAFAAPGSKANDRAIERLKSKLKTVRAPVYVKAIRECLLDLYTVQGRVADAKAVAAQLSGKPLPAPTTTSAPRRAAGVLPAWHKGPTAMVLKMAALSMRAKEYSAVAAGLEARLRDFPAGELPRAMAMIGQARLNLGKAAKDPAERKALLIAGGLSLMRVVAYYPKSREAPAALLRAGEVHEHLPAPNLAAARLAYLGVMTRYGTSPAAKQAQKALERLGKKKT